MLKWDVLRVSERFGKGRYLNDVRTEGGGGVTQYVTNTTDRLRVCVTKGGGGPKSQKFCGRHLSIAPSRKMTSHSLLSLQ